MEERILTRSLAVGVWSGIERASHARGPTVENVGVDHGRLQIAVSEKLLNGSDVVAAVEEVRGERVPKRVTRRGFRDSRPDDCLMNVPLDDRRIHVVAPFLTGLGILPTGALGKYPLPTPCFSRVGILDGQRIRKSRLAPA